MAAHIQPAGVADAGIAGETAAPPPIRRKRKLGSGIEIVLLAIFAIVGSASIGLFLFPLVLLLIASATLTPLSGGRPAP